MRLLWAGHVARKDETRSAYRILVLAGKVLGKFPYGRPRRGWEDNIKMNRKDMGFGDRR
jgi:hypothetical protein